MSSAVMPKPSDPFFRDAKQYYPVTTYKFSRAGAFLALSIDNTRPYYELGYGFSTRFISLGLFTSFLSSEFQSFDIKFTFELFRRW